jgi:hypothetical protein
MCLSEGLHFLRFPRFAIEERWIFGTNEESDALKGKGQQ